MESFDQLAAQFDQMIHKIMWSLRIYKNKEEFYQTALIALWEASRNFDSSKGNFPTYAYRCMKGRLQTEMTDKNIQHQRSVYPEEEFWELIENKENEEPFEREQILTYCQGLSERETKWVLAEFVEGLSTDQLARREHVSISAVKHWRVNAMKKLRGCSRC